jgi:hypothetical protein
MMQAALLDRMFVPMAGSSENLGVQVIIEIMPDGGLQQVSWRFFQELKVADRQLSQKLRIMPTTKKRRDETKFCLLPPLDPETYAGLKANIAVNGVQVPVIKDEKGYILDGFAREKIAKELGYDCPSVTATGLSEQEKRSQVRALNLSRRQLDYAAKRQIIADELKENPDRANRWIARSLGVHHATVIAVRNDLTSTGHIDHLGGLVGIDGKIRSATGSISPNDSECPDQRTYYNFRLGKLRPRPADQQTPTGLTRFLYETISPKYEVQTILDPCAGQKARKRSTSRL